MGERERDGDFKAVSFKGAVHPQNNLILGAFFVKRDPVCVQLMQLLNSAVVLLNING